jgi:hypothetical protein
MDVMKTLLGFERARTKLAAEDWVNNIHERTARCAR